MGSTSQAARNKQVEGAITKKEAQATEEQILYAKILDIGMKIGLGGIIVSFIVYVAGVLSPKVPVNQISNYWGMKSHDYLETLNISGGWSWLGKYSYGDFLNFFPIAFLAGITIICYLAILPSLLKKKDNVYAVLAILEVIVLASAASGLISAGGH